MERSFVKVYYRAIAEPPFYPDASGYVEEKSLLPGDSEEYMSWDENDEAVANEGYEFVYENSDGSGEYWLVAQDDIWTEVIENSALSGGYGMPYPGGGLTATSGYDIESEVNGEKLYLKQYYF